jgi:hypothetical protein
LQHVGLHARRRRLARRHLGAECRR